MERQAGAAGRIKSSLRGLLFICGKNLAFQEEKGPAPSFFRAVRWAACSARTGRSRSEKQGRRSAFQIFLELQEQKANNINLVTPTHYVPQIISAVENARRMGLVIPVVYNTASYERPETVRMLMGTVDIFLPDLKYYDTALSAKYSFAPDYFDVASKAIREMVSISGKCEFDRGMLRKGTVVRHMILPGHTKDSKQILRYLHETYGDDIYISIMNQYTPMPGIGERYPELGRRITRREYDKVVDFALQIGITNAFVQEGETAKESFIPEFDGTGL